MLGALLPWLASGSVRVGLEACSRKAACSEAPAVPGRFRCPDASRLQYLCVLDCVREGTMRVEMVSS